MSLIVIIRRLFFCFIPLLFNSCFLIKIPVKTNSAPIKDTVNVYHFIVSSSSKKIADTATSNSFIRESKKAYDWITKEASKRGQTLIFKEFWPTNKDTNLKRTFIHKLPNNSLQVLTRKSTFQVVTRKKTKTQEQKVERVNWNKALFDSIVKQINDSSVCRIIHKSNESGLTASDNKLIMVHLLKARKSRILGFYKASRAYIGSNKSSTIGHETLHYLGAPDLYIHKYWFGKRRRIVKKELRQEIMDGSIGKNFDCTTYYISNYTAYTMAWDKNIENEYKPILRQNLMAKIIFYISLFF